MAHDVFISYATPDKPTADAAVSILEHQWVRCWVAPRDVLAGTASSWASQIEVAIRGSKLLVLVFSGHANKSRMVEREINLALDSGIQIIPFRIENVKPDGGLAFYIGTMHWLDAFTAPLEGHLEKLGEVVRKNLPAGAPANAMSARAPFKSRAVDVPPSEPLGSGPNTTVKPSPAANVAARISRKSIAVIGFFAALVGLFFAVFNSIIPTSDDVTARKTVDSLSLPNPNATNRSPSGQINPGENLRPTQVSPTVEPQPAKPPLENLDLVSRENRSQEPKPGPSVQLTSPDIAEDMAKSMEASLGLTYRQRRDVQQALSNEHIYSGPFDGQFGSNTRRAIADYQKNVGEQPTGYVDSRLLSIFTEMARQTSVESAKPPLQTKAAGPQTQATALSQYSARPPVAFQSVDVVRCMLPDGSQQSIDRTSCRSRVGVILP